MPISSADVKARRERSTRHIAFSVSGGCYPYQMGVASYMQHNFDLSDVFFSGASGGTWPATLLAAGERIDDALEVLVAIGPKCCEGRGLLSPLGAYGVYDQGVKMVFDKVFEGKNLPSIVNGKLAISITRLCWENTIPFLKDEVVSSFLSNDDVYQCIITSCLIPFAVNGKPFVKFRNWSVCLDAGLTNVPGVLRSYQRSGSALKHIPADKESLYVEVFPLEQSEGSCSCDEEGQQAGIASDTTCMMDEDASSDDDEQQSAVESCCSPVSQGSDSKHLWIGSLPLLAEKLAPWLGQLLLLPEAARGPESPTGSPLVSEGCVNDNEASLAASVMTNLTFESLVGIWSTALPKPVAHAAGFVSDNITAEFSRSRSSSICTEEALEHAPIAPQPYGILNLGVLTINALTHHLIGNVATKVDKAKHSATDLVAWAAASATEGIERVASAPGALFLLEAVPPRTDVNRAAIPKSSAPSKNATKPLSLADVADSIRTLLASTVAPLTRSLPLSLLSSRATAKVSVSKPPSTTQQGRGVKVTSSPVGKSAVSVAYSREVTGVPSTSCSPARRAPTDSLVTVQQQQQQQQHCDGGSVGLDMDTEQEKIPELPVSSTKITAWRDVSSPTSDIESGKVPAEGRDCVTTNTEDVLASLADRPSVANLVDLTVVQVPSTYATSCISPVGLRADFDVEAPPAGSFERTSGDWLDTTAAEKIATLPAATPEKTPEDCEAQVVDQDSSALKEEEELSSKKHPHHQHGKGNFWYRKGHAVKKIPTGGRLLEIAPWTWRKQPLIHYHLTGDGPAVRMLYDLGYADAQKHHAELLTFFSGRGRCSPLAQANTVPSTENADINVNINTGKNTSGAHPSFPAVSMV